jgi:hypothetical protein
MAEGRVDFRQWWRRRRVPLFVHTRVYVQLAVKLAAAWPATTHLCPAGARGPYPLKALGHSCRDLSSGSVPLAIRARLAEVAASGSSGSSGVSRLAGTGRLRSCTCFTFGARDDSYALIGACCATGAFAMPYWCFGNDRDTHASPLVRIFVLSKSYAYACVAACSRVHYNNSKYINVQSCIQPMHE